MSEQKPGTGKKQVKALLVDDDTFMLDFVGEMLEELGVAKVITACDGKRGIDAYDAAQPKPDVILCDLHMPGQDGFQFMEAIGKRGFTGGVVLISGQNNRVLNSATLMGSFHQLNILAALEKPVTKATLAGALSKLL